MFRKDPDAHYPFGFIGGWIIYLAIVAFWVAIGVAIIWTLIR